MKKEGFYKIIVEGVETPYLISRTGEVYSKLVNRLLKPNLRSGYHYVNLKVGDIRKTYAVHRLVCMTFIPNPENKPNVNHKNEIRIDNRVENLEWCTQSENVQHSYNTGKNTKASQVSKYTLEGDFVRTYDSIKQAIDDTPDSNSGKISLCCSLKRKTHNGFQWRYGNSQEKLPKQSEPKTKRQKVKQIDINTGEVVGTYNSLAEAAKAIGCCSSQISMVLSGRIKRCKNFTFERC